MRIILRHPNPSASNNHAHRGESSAVNDIKGYDDIKELVDTFYGHLQQDERLGYIFNEVVKLDWSEHLPVMYKFWTTVLFSEPAYKGNPRAAHEKVQAMLHSSTGSGIQRSDFERWLELFHGTVDELFVGPTADRAKASSAQIASNLTFALNIPSPRVDAS